MAADPGQFLLLFGMGYREFSLPAPFIPRMKELLAAVTTAEAEELAAGALAAVERGPIAAALERLLARARPPGGAPA
jgi:phosphotransferase system enzyme I (PtsP)